MGFGIMDADHSILRANPAAHRLFGTPAGKLAGNTIRRYIPALGRVDLSKQHFQNFRERMSDYPVSIEMLSRFRSPAEQRKTLQQIQRRR